MTNRTCQKCRKEFMCNGFCNKTCPLPIKYIDLSSCSCEECCKANKEDEDCSNIPLIKVREEVHFT